MIKPGQIEEWVREASERPPSAALIIRQIAARLDELASRNEDLLAENIALRSGEKVEEYESRITNLEFQLEMLKRQIDGTITAPRLDVLNLVVYDVQGRILRIELNPDDLISSNVIASLPEKMDDIHDPPGLLVVGSQEELLIVFNTGRTVSFPVTEIPAAGPEVIDWGQAFLQEPQVSEVLVTILPIARMALFEFCVQVSRRGYVKKIRETFLETYISNGNIGSGVVGPPDQTCALAMCSGDDLLVVVSKEGNLMSVAVDQLPYTIDEVHRLHKTDHVVTAFIPGNKASFLAITQNGKAFHRDTSWLDDNSSIKTRGRAVLSKARREAGMRVVGAAAVDADGWSVILTSDGCFTLHKIGDIFGKGTVLKNSSELEVQNFTAFETDGENSGTVEGP